MDSLRGALSHRASLFLLILLDQACRCGRLAAGAAGVSGVVALRGIDPHTWVASPGSALLAGCRCRPVLRDDTPHDALMWWHGGKRARNPRS